jgi:histidinol-phosphate phosphatase family protein
MQMKSIEQAAILCGGLGTRLRPYTDTLPKPMIPIHGRPFLEFLVEQLHDQGIKRIVLLTGYRGEQIRSHFRDGRDFGVDISYSAGPAEWETGRRVWEARDTLDVQFLLLYSDNFIPFSLAKSIEFHRTQDCPVSLLLNAKTNGNIRVASSGVIDNYDPSRKAPGLDYVELGYMVVERDPVLQLLTAPDASFSVVLKTLADSGKLAGLVSGDSYHSISDPRRWKTTEQYLTPKRILLIDRDGTINVRPPRAEYIHRFEDIQFLPGALEGMHALSQARFSFIVISNQAGIARGMIGAETVDAVNASLREFLSFRGIEILKFYVCPHHWDEGCRCRKPAPGLFFDASREHLLRLDRTLYIGDDPRDCQAAYNADCPCVYVGGANELSSLPAPAAPACVAKTINESVSWIVGRFQSWETHLRRAGTTTK